MAWASIAVNVFLVGLNLAVAAASGSLAVAAEMVHNVVDLVAAVAVLGGIKISERKSRAFPYGLYKVENVVSVMIAGLIFFAGYEIAREALLAEPQAATVSPLILGGVALSMAVPLAFSVVEMRTGQHLNSPSLIADAQEYRVHVFSSGLVLVALVGQEIGVPLDRVAALMIVVLIAKTGWDLLADGMRVLLDASLEPETLDQVQAVVEAEPAVTEIRSLRGRNAGRFRFLELDVALRVDDLEKAHAVSKRIEQALHRQVPHLDRVVIHYEPQRRLHLHYAVPLADPNGTVGDHFGEAPYFAMVTVRTADGTIERQEIVANPHQQVEKAKGIQVGEWLVDLKADVVLLREDVHGRGPAYVFADAGVETRRTEATTLSQAVAEQIEELSGPG
jgi:cation diffusion facilitator family transporter